MKTTLTDPSLMPAYAKPGDAGMDLRARLKERVTLVPGVIVSIPTGVSVSLPPDVVGFVCPRSGLALKYGLTVVNAPGVIDSSFRGEICVILQVRGNYLLEINPGDRIAQLVLMPCFTASIEVVDALDETDRGKDGFGSTGAE
jgi:dUTP pyrophosphatase